MDDILVAYILLVGKFLFPHDQGYHNEQISHYYWNRELSDKLQSLYDTLLKSPYQRVANYKMLGASYCSQNHIPINMNA